MTSCNNANSNAYIGTYVSTNSDSGLFANPSLPLGGFSNTWVFNFAPGGSATMNANFIPGFPNTNSISSFQVSLFSASAAGGCTANTPGTSGLCTGLSLGPLSLPASTSGNSSSIGFTLVPEPTCLALVGLALCGLGATLHTRKQA